MAKQITAAAIDVGSNDVIMKIALLKSGDAPKIIDQVQRTIPMGAATYSTGKISQHLLDQTIDVLKSFNKKMEEYKVSHMRATATSAFREASNRLFAVEQIRRQTGIDVNVLSNSMDLYYHQIALSETIPTFNALIETNALVLIIGSGSIQLTLYNEGKYVNTQNFRLGSLRIRELLGDLERHSSDFGALMAEYISGELNYYKTFGPKRSSYQNLIVTGGSSRYIRHVAGWNSKHQEPITLSDYQVFFDRMRRGAKSEMLRMGNVPSEQEMLLLPACIVIDEVLSFTGTNQFFLSEIDLADGMLYEMASTLQNYKLIRDPEINRIESAYYLANRYRTDKKHSQHVSELTLRLFDLTRKIHGLPSSTRIYLQISSLLHNIGKYISMENDGIRSYNIIQSNEIIGLDEKEMEIISLVACFHNGHLTANDPMLERLTDAEKILVMKLVAYLALGNSLDAGHKQKVEILRTQVVDDKLEILVSADQDFTLEMWNFYKHTAIFTEMFGLIPELRRRKTSEK